VNLRKPESREIAVRFFSVRLDQAAAELKLLGRENISGSGQMSESAETLEEMVLAVNLNELPVFAVVYVLST
jgi:hypothetical protein